MIAVEVGQRYRGRGGSRRIQIEGVDAQRADKDGRIPPPIVSARELVREQRCGSRLLHDGGACACEARPSREPITIFATFRDGAWRLPAWYLQE